MSMNYELIDTIWYTGEDEFALSSFQNFKIKVMFLQIMQEITQLMNIREFRLRSGRYYQSDFDKMIIDVRKLEYK